MVQIAANHHDKSVSEHFNLTAFTESTSRSHRICMTARAPLP